MCARDFVQVAPGGTENTYWKIHKKHPRLGRNYRQFVGSCYSDVNGVQTERTERPRCGGAKGMSMSCCMCEPVETAQSLWRYHKFGSYTAKVGTRARIAHRVWSTVSVGGKPGSRTCALTGTRAKVKARPRPLVSANRRKSRSGKATLSKFTCVDNQPTNRQPTTDKG